MTVRAALSVLFVVVLAVAGVVVTAWLNQLEPRATHAHTYQECLAKSYGDAPRPCFVIDDGVLIERRADPAT